MEEDNTLFLDLKEVSREEFKDAVEFCDCDIGEPRDENDIVVTHYTQRGTYVGTMAVTEDGTEYFLEDLPEDGITMKEAHELFYGA